MNVDEDGQIALRNTKYVPTSEADREERIVRAGDVIFNNTNSPDLVGKTAFYDQPGTVAFSNHMTRIRCRQEAIAGRFCAVALHQLWREGYFKANCNNHVSQASISRTVIEDTSIPVPPLAEQQRILDKLDEVLSRVNAARDRLARVPVILKRFRQAVLAAACSGRLTEDWRTQLAQPSAATDMEEARDLPDIPVSWSWRRLPDLGQLARGRSRHRPRDAKHLYGGHYPFIQTGDVARSGGRIETYQQTYSEAGLAQSRLWPAGTVCITIAANIANSGVLTYPACFPDSVVGFVANATLCRGAFVEYFVRTARSSLAEFAPATAQKNINLETLSNLMVPCPPVVEQEEIVRRVDALFALADLVERRVVSASFRADRLTQALLAKAFRGQLVPTEAELARQEGRPFETADDLLARIRETPVETRPKRSPRGRRRSTAT